MEGRLSLSPNSGRGTALHRALPGDSGPAGAPDDPCGACRASGRGGGSSGSERTSGGEASTFEAPALADQALAAVAHKRAAADAALGSLGEPASKRRGVDGTPADIPEAAAAHLHIFAAGGRSSTASGPEEPRGEAAAARSPGAAASSDRALGGAQAAERVQAFDLLFLLPGWSANVARHLGIVRSASSSPLMSLGRSAAAGLFEDALSLTMTSLRPLAEGLGDCRRARKEARYDSLLAWYDFTRAMCRALGVRASVPAPLRLRQTKLAAFDRTLLFELPRRGHLGIVGHAALRGWCATLVCLLGTNFSRACPLLSTCRSVAARVYQDVEILTQSSTLAVAQSLRCAPKWGLKEEINFHKLLSWSAFLDTLNAFELHGLGVCDHVLREFDEALACAVVTRYNAYSAGVDP